jgi:hypothetical protein
MENKELEKAIKYLELRSATLIAENILCAMISKSSVDNRWIGSEDIKMAFHLADEFIRQRDERRER